MKTPRIAYHNDTIQLSNMANTFDANYGRKWLRIEKAFMRVYKYYKTIKLLNYEYTRTKNRELRPKE